MQLKKPADFDQHRGRDQFESSILSYNSVNDDDIDGMFPDFGNSYYSLDDFTSIMSDIGQANEFVDYIKNHADSKYCVIGDYDCDGIMATVIMCYALTMCGVDCTYVCPDRFNDGYGMKEKHIDYAIASGCDVILTVDNGITANGPIDYARSKGLRVMVTDHHTPQGENHADVCVDPLYNEDAYRLSSGATVAFKVAYLLWKEFGFDKRVLDDLEACAAITVFSDVMPMVGENRILVKAALIYMNDQVRIEGSFINRLARLVDYYVPGKRSDPYLNLDGTFRDFDKDNIDFYFVPIINAANRVIGNVNDLVYDIMSLFSGEYNDIPHLYPGINQKRKYMRRDLNRLHRKDDGTDAVIEFIDTKDLMEDNYGGIVGLVASDVVEKEGKPALIGTERTPDGHGRYSGRSVSGFNLFEALTKIKTEHPELDFSFGGHAEALGFSCKDGDRAAIQGYLSEAFDEYRKGAASEEETLIQLSGPDDVKSYIGAYSNLWPYGNKFEFPKFYAESTIKFYNKEDRSFTTNLLGWEYPIIFFDYDAKLRIENYAFKNRQAVMRMRLCLMEDPSGCVTLKLDRLL